MTAYPRNKVTGIAAQAQLGGKAQNKACKVTLF